MGVKVTFLSDIFVLTSLFQKYKMNAILSNIYIYQNKLHKACFQQDIAHGDFEDLNRRTVANKVLIDEEFDIAKYMMNINGDFLQWSIIFLIIKLQKEQLKMIVFVIKN